LNLLQLAPGGHLGRFIIWSADAFSKLDALYGTTRKPSALKVDYHLPTSVITQTDIHRIINSDEIQSVVRPAKAKATKRPYTQHKNPLKNFGVLVRLNPYAQTTRRHELMKSGPLSKIVKKKSVKVAPGKDKKVVPKDKKVAPKPARTLKKKDIKKMNKKFVESLKSE